MFLELTPRTPIEIKPMPMGVLGVQEQSPKAPAPPEEKKTKKN